MTLFGNYLENDYQSTMGAIGDNNIVNCENWSIAKKKPKYYYETEWQLERFHCITIIILILYYTINVTC